ncbi:hypothetical protein CRP01_04700 [Flavilitoribacter nigricans DSM 23189 = NBRC 102662]|uniref:Uncharacterized protein n=2 Tax=Flavilitoribacter TaxID=2762562 RepID=A0A2D0NH57_FLAN2|nr:hypothetical protein CRP01_04700 [Flavilitoribacter nigricans DSM 23189 = NBRC 102662]
MSFSIPIRRTAGLTMYIIIPLLLIFSILYIKTSVSTASTLEQYLSAQFEGEISRHVLEEAIQYSTEKLSTELDIDLENIDITMDTYREIVREATEKFGRCQQYRLLILEPGRFPCYTCNSRKSVLLSAGQSFKIGQTCGNEKSRYGSNLPAAGLRYFLEFEGNAFEVLVAEYIQLKLFEFSGERKLILQANQLTESEMLLPPGNKITR